MASSTRSLTLADLPDFLAGLGESLQRIDFAKPLATVGLYLASQAQQRFDEQRSPDGVPWADWARPPSEKRGGPTAKLLRDTDVLMASLTSQAHAEHIEEATSASLLWGTNLPYSSFQQEGTEDIPARPFLGINDKMRGRIGLILTDYVERVLTGGQQP